MLGVWCRFAETGHHSSANSASDSVPATDLSVLGVEPSYADAELVEWEDWDIGATDREHPVTRGLHVGFRARDRAQIDAFYRLSRSAGCATSRAIARHRSKSAPVRSTGCTRRSRTPGSSST